MIVHVETGSRFLCDCGWFSPHVNGAAEVVDHRFMAGCKEPGGWRLGTWLIAPGLPSLCGEVQGRSPRRGRYWGGHVGVLDRP